MLGGFGVLVTGVFAGFAGDVGLGFSGCCGDRVLDHEGRDSAFEELTVLEGATGEMVGN